MESYKPPQIIRDGFKIASLIGLKSKALLVLHAQISEELRRRGVVRSSNNPVGDLAEHLFCRAFGWNQGGNADANVDAVGNDGTRYQIKARRLTSHNPSRQLSAIRDLRKNKFDKLAACLFDEQYRVIKAAIVPRSVVMELATFVERTNSSRFLLRDTVWGRQGVDDVTTKIRKALATLS